MTVDTTTTPNPADPGVYMITLTPQTPNKSTVRSA